MQEITFLDKRLIILTYLCYLAIICNLDLFKCCSHNVFRDQVLYDRWSEVLRLVFLAGNHKQME